MGKDPTQSYVGVSINSNVRKVVLDVFLKVELFNSETNILPLLHSRPALRGLQSKVLDGYCGQQDDLPVLYLKSPVL